MNALVLDGSATLGFLLQDEKDAFSLQTLTLIRSGVAIFVPAHWPAEVANGLLMAERRKRSTPAETQEALGLALGLSVIIDDETALRIAGDTLALARQYSLAIYDAAYLELALRRGATLATTDRALVKAARAVGAAVLSS